MSASQEHTTATSSSASQLERSLTTSAGPLGTPVRKDTCSNQLSTSCTLETASSTSQESDSTSHQSKLLVKRNFDDSFNFPESFEKIVANLNHNSGWKKTKKRDLSDDLVNLIISNDIYSMQDWDNLDVSLKKDFLSLPNLNGILTATIYAVAARRLQAPFYVDYTSLPAEKLTLLQPESDYLPKIPQMLSTVHTWSEQKCIWFTKLLRDVINRKTGKRNTIWLCGPTNAGKTQLFQSFVNAFFNGVYGVPSGNPRSGFPFGSCVKKRLIYWDEPTIHPDNIEVLKSVFGGNPTMVDMKYKSEQLLDPTPCLVTANFPPWHNQQISNKPVWLNRMYLFYLFTIPNNDINNYFPLTKKDWMEYFFWADQRFSKIEKVKDLSFTN